MVRFITKAALRLALVLGLHPVVYAQTLSLSRALDAAVQQHPAARSAGLQVQQQQQLLPGATALAQPVVTAESPTGNFYTVGVTQSFELPGVYRRRKDLQKSRIVRAESNVAAIVQEIRYNTALVYNELQYRAALVDELRIQDTILQTVAGAAKRQFQQGVVDAVAQQFAALQAAILRSKLHQAEQDMLISEQQLQMLTGITGKIVPEPWEKPVAAPLADTLLWQNNPALKVYMQETLVAEQQVAVEKSAGLPQFSLGYINQGERESPVYNRLNAGVSVPLWRKQYRAGVIAAQTGVEIARQNLAAQTLEIGMAWQNALGEAEKNRLAVEDYEQNVLPGARALADVSRRMHEGGLTGLPDYLRNRKDSLEAELTYRELLRDYHTSVLYTRFLAGRL